MSAGSQSPDEVLQDYFNSLLDDAPAAAASAPVAPAISNVATLPAARTAREARIENSTPRPYAEPIRTLNLRVPLPTVVAPAIEPIALAPAVSPSIAPPEEPIAPIREPVVAPVAAEKQLAEQAPELEQDSLGSMAAPADWLANGRPAWAQQSFECLLFRVGGLALAAPLCELGAIYPLKQDSLTSIFGQSSWFMGLLPVKDYNVRTIDTALVVMPERYELAIRECYRYVISLYGADWGLGVDEVMNSVRLDPDQVRWRGQRSKRPWLAGTVVDHMCALLDIGQLAWMFHNQDRKRRLPPRP